MTKRDSVAAGFTFPPLSMSMPCRHSRSAGHTGNNSDWQDSSFPSSYSDWQDSSFPSSSYTGHYDYQSWHTHPAQGYADHSHSPGYPVSPSPTPLPTTSSYQTPIIPQGRLTQQKNIHFNNRSKSTDVNYMLTTLWKFVLLRLIETYLTSVALW